MKKAISILLSICMLLSITTGLNLTAYAETYFGSCGEKLTWSLDTSTGELNITGTGEMYDYSIHNDDSYVPPWYSYCSNIKKANIGNGITSIGDDAFSGCDSLTSITIPDSVTSIGGGAFWGCESLTSVTIGNSVTSIGGSAFYNCTSLTSVTIPNSVTSIGSYAFYNTAYYNDENNWVNDVLYIDNCLIDAINTISGSCNINTNTRIIADNVFEYCNSLTSVIIPDSVTSIGDGTFEYCDSLTSVTIPDSVTSSIGGRAFYNCTSLTSVTLGNSIESIGNSAFWGCESLTSVTIGNSVTNIDNYAFYCCTSLTKTNYTGTIDEWCKINFENLYSNPIYYSNNLYINNKLITEVNITTAEKINTDAFRYCTSLTEINVDSQNPNYSSQDGVLYNKDKTELIQYPVGNCRTSFTIPDSVTSIGQFAFWGYTSLTSVIIENKDCCIFDSPNTIPTKTKIFGYTGSTAEKYAIKYNRTFFDINHPHGYVLNATESPTCIDSGVKTYFCYICGYNYTEVIPATGHNFGNNSATCSVCGIANPNYVAPQPSTPAVPSTPTQPTQPNQSTPAVPSIQYELPQAPVLKVSKPKRVKLSKVTAGKKRFKVTWKKVKGISGYQVQYSTSKKFTKKTTKTKTVKGAKKTSATIKKLKSKKKYYVRVRAYKTTKSGNVYGSWSKVKTVKVK